MQIGDIVYLYTIDLNPVLAIKQELIPNRFCRISNITTVKGGSNKEQYLQYSATSLLDDNITYTINNYLSPYKYCSLEELEQSIEFLKDGLVEENYDNMKYLIKKIKEMTK